jgi:hypothetical protein
LRRTLLLVLDAFELAPVLDLVAAGDRARRNLRNGNARGEAG